MPAQIEVPTDLNENDRKRIMVICDFFYKNNINLLKIVKCGGMDNTICFYYSGGDINKRDIKKAIDEIWLRY